MPEPQHCPSCFNPSTPIVVLDAQHKPGGLKCRYCGARFATPDAVRVAQSLLRRKDDHPTPSPVARVEPEASKVARQALERECTRVRNSIWYDYRRGPFYRSNVAVCWRETCREFERAIGLALGGHGDEDLRRALRTYVALLEPAQIPVTKVQHTRTEDGRPIVNVHVAPPAVSVQNVVQPAPVVIHEQPSKPRKITLDTPRGTVTGTSEDA